MRKIFFLIIFATVILGGCGKGPSLSEEEARTLIEKHLELPVIHFSNDKLPYYLGTKEGEGIEQLIRDGYLNKEGIRIEGIYRYIPTDKGDANSIRGVSFSEVHRPFYLFSGPVALKVLKSIDEIAVNDETGIAAVTSTLGFEPYEPFYSMLCKETTNCDLSGERLNRIEQTELRFKHSDKGWGIVPE